MLVSYSVIAVEFRRVDVHNPEAAAANNNQLRVCYEGRDKQLNP